ncbi:MAG TPA: 6,7-dimethyl-8-ribityllumazine synthase [archaeon]|nr:6,7-dimethyl-8-ribityllumazine synthase [archaeon]
MEEHVMKIAIIAADFHKKIAQEMISNAKRAAQAKGIEVASIVKVCGCFEIPLALKRELARTDIDGAVVLGALVQGETSHDEIVAYTVAEKVSDLSLKFDKPVGYGITGPRMSVAQAKARAKDFSVRSVEAVARILKIA